MPQLIAAVVIIILKILRHVVGIYLNDTHIHRIQVNSFKWHHQPAGIGQDNPFTRNGNRWHPVFKKHIAGIDLFYLLA